MSLITAYTAAERHKANATPREDIEPLRSNDLLRVQAGVPTVVS